MIGFLSHRRYSLAWSHDFNTVTYERNHPKGGINILEVIQIYTPNKLQNS